MSSRVVRLWLVSLLAAHGCRATSPSAEACDAANFSLQADPPLILAGQPSKLTATYQAGSGTVAPDVGAIARGGSATVQPATTTTYVLTVPGTDCRATATVTVVQPGDINVAVQPAAVSLDQGAAQAFGASVTGFDTDPSVVWSVQESGGGTIDADGGYVAPNAAGTFHVVAASHAAPSRTGKAAVTVASVAITAGPQGVLVEKLTSQLLTATVTGSVNHGVDWSVQTPGGGTIDATGTYQAPSATGTYTVVATSQADPSKQATVAVKVVDVLVKVSPATATVAAGATQPFTAAVLGIDDQSVVWSIQEPNSGATIGSDGTLTAPIAGGTIHVIASSAPVPTAQGSATVTVTGGLPAAASMSNTTVGVHGSTARVTFDPVDGAADYRIFVAPQTGDLVAQADGGTAIHNGIYRCAGEIETHPAPNDAEPEPDPSGYLHTYLNHDVGGYTRTLAEATLGYVYTTPAAGRVAVYAMGDSNKNADNNCYYQRWAASRAKKYVTDPNERAQLLAASWRDDGVAFYLPPPSASGLATVYTSTGLIGTKPARYYFLAGPEKSARSSPAAAFSVLAAAASDTKPLMRVFYDGGCGQAHDELVAGQARFDKAAHQGPRPIPLVNWSGMSGSTTLVVEALDQQCPFQGHLSPRAVPAGGVHQQYFTLDQLRAADPQGEVYVNGQSDAGVKPRAIARAIVQAAPAPLEPMDFSDDFAQPDGGILPMTPTGSPPFQSLHFDTPAYDITFYNIDTPATTAPSSNWFWGVGPMLGELWVTFADWASDTNGKFRLTPKAKATLADSSYVHVMDEVDVVTTDRRYPQILISTSGVAVPVQENLVNGTTVLVQTFGLWPPRIDIELCDHRTWDVNNQCPRFLTDPISQQPFAGFALPPHAEVGDLAGVDRRVRFDVWASTKKVYVEIEGQPWACAVLPTALPAGSATVTIGDVLYHSGVDVPSVPYPFHRAHLYTETRRHFGALGFKSGDPGPPNWDETRLPCTTAAPQ